MRLLIAEKPSVAKAIAAELGATGKGVQSAQMRGLRQRAIAPSNREEKGWLLVELQRLPQLQTDLCRLERQARLQPSQKRFNPQGAISMTPLPNDHANREAIPARDDENATSAQVLREKLIDAMTPGYQVEFDPVEAERAGAFEESALSEADALASTDDLAA